MAEETKHDLLIKRIQISIGILVGIVSLVLGLYNVKNTVFSKQGTGPGALSLVLHGAEGRPVPGARIELLNDRNVLVAASETDASGRYQRQGMAAGNYSLKVNKTGFEPEIVVVGVRPKDTTELTLVLRMAGGNPVQSALEEVGADWIKRWGATHGPGEAKPSDAPTPDNTP